MITSTQTKAGTLLFWYTGEPVQTVTRNVRPPAASLPKPARPRAAEVIEAAAKAYGFPVEEMRGPERTRIKTHARAAVVWALRQVEPVPGYGTLSRLLGRRDHGTAEYLYRRAEEWRAKYPQFLEVSDSLVFLLL